MKSIAELAQEDRLVLEELKSGIGRELPGCPFRLTLFGSKARGDADLESDIDVLVELDIPRVSFAEKRRLQHLAGDISIKWGILLCLLVVDQRMRDEKGDYSIFRNIQEEGIPV